MLAYRLFQSYRRIICPARACCYISAFFGTLFEPMLRTGLRLLLASPSFNTAPPSSLISLSFNLLPLSAVVDC